MASAGEVVQGFMQALGKGDFASARKFLDDNLSFQGPIDKFQRPEPYLESLKKLHHIVERVDMKKFLLTGTMFVSSTIWSRTRRRARRLLPNGTK